MLDVYKRQRQDFAKNYGGADAAETCGYPSKYDYNRSKEMCIRDSTYPSGILRTGVDSPVNDA